MGALPSSTVSHEVIASLSSSPTRSPPVSPRPASSTWSMQVRPSRSSLSAALPREVIMLAIATAALIFLATTAEAAFMKYDHGGREIYKHEDYDSFEHNRGDNYPEPSHKSHYADQYHGHKPSYEIQDYSLRPHHDSYDEDHYGRYAYSVEPSYSHESSSPSYKQTHLPHYRHKRGADKKDDDDEDGKDEKDDDDGDDEEEEETEVDTETWVNLADSLSLIARKLADRDDDGDDEDDEEEMHMSEASTYTYEPIRKSKKHRKSH